MVGDKGYRSGKTRRMLRRRHVTPVFPTKSTERRQPCFDRELFHERTTVERLINRLKQFRRIATRYEQLAVNFLAMVTLAALLIWLEASEHSLAAPALVPSPSQFSQQGGLARRRGEGGADGVGGEAH